MVQLTSFRLGEGEGRCWFEVREGRSPHNLEQGEVAPCGRDFEAL